MKLNFHLEQDEDGYPPASVESLWVTASSNRNEYVLDNVPFFARDATIGDTVRVREEDGQLWFEALVARSENSLLRIVFFDPAYVEEVGGRLEGFGCSIEYLRAHKLMSVSVPGEVELAAVQAYLQAEASKGHLDYEEPILRQ
jgi:hypothetical protein